MSNRSTAQRQNKNKNVQNELANKTSQPISFINSIDEIEAWLNMWPVLVPQKRKCERKKPYGINMHNAMHARVC